MNTPKERPILMNGEMVRAVLSGRKSQTRRIVTDKHFKRLGLERDGDYIYTTEGPQWDGTFEGVAPWSPFGSAGDRLYVRESHWFRLTDGITTYADGSFRTHPSAIIGSKYIHADDVDNWPKMAKSFGFKSVPSIHMPRWASRITLEITGVRVERLQDISEADAIAEGIAKHGDQWIDYPAGKSAAGWNDPRKSFTSLWQSINGGDSWNANPWVWVVEFRKLEAAQ
jgi:hypothetical protein